MDESDLEAMGLMIDPENPKQAIPLPQKPAADMGVPELESLARQEYQRLIVSERQTVACYWRLGDCLLPLREKAAYGDWQDYVRQTLKMDRNRPTRALRLRRKFERIEHCQNLTLKDALDYEPREPKGSSGNSEQPSSEAAPSFNLVADDPDSDSEFDPDPEPELESDEEPDDSEKLSEEGLDPLFELVAVVQGLQTVLEELKDAEIDDATRTTLSEQVGFVEELVVAIRSHLG